MVDVAVRFFPYSRLCADNGVGDSTRTRCTDIEEQGDRCCLRLEITERSHMLHFIAVGLDNFISSLTCSSM